MKNTSFITTSIIILLQIIIMILTITTFERIQPSVVFLSSILANWNNTPIKSVELFKDDCPVGFHSLKVNNFLINCNFDFENDYLESEEKEESLVLSDNMLKTICYSRNYPLDYVSYIRRYYKNNSTCLESEQDCGLIDTLDNRLCIKKTEECPINYVKIINNSAKKLKELTYYQLNYNYSLAFTNKLQADDNEKKVQVDLEVLRGNCIYLFIYIYIYVLK